MNYDIGHVSINILYYLCSNGCFNRSPQPKQKPKITSAHRLGFKIRLLNTALEMLKVEKQDKEKEREQVLSERIPPLHLSSLSVQALQIQEMNQKINEMKSKLKRPNLKRVKLSAEHMLSVLLGSRHTQSIDFKANLKTVKKEEEKKEEVTDWCKNVEAMSGMEGRKKLFDAGQYDGSSTKPKMTSKICQPATTYQEEEETLSMSVNNSFMFKVP
ncbi:troponin I, slow skeletal muscle-like isoform X2 [Sinocyclocheilus rhinocerous]|uniref:troponin I, slow skeletal muscle-like isoform X2 n=1 Tax=Sinocyclocheilus rhinocerous TaxID=307959 RepID=UPI0007BABEF9|nr:PREDICTED: troponin I, slow skeletal muscle-like isoform X2 [Sinocyclocheilus rhinocerous]